MTGYEKEEIRTFDQWAKHAVYGDDADAVRDFMNKLFSSSSSSSSEFIIHTKTGQTRYWIFNASTVGTLADGRRFVVGMALDITERRQAENAIQKLNEELEQKVAQRTATAEQRTTQLRALTVKLAQTEHNHKVRSFKILVLGSILPLK
jgi:PAS domain S-box-containing protein